MNPISIIDIYKTAWSLAKKNWIFLVLLTLVLIVTNGVLVLLFHHTILGFILFIISAVFIMLRLYLTSYVIFYKRIGETKL